jgi:hypothetical protein
MCAKCSCLFNFQSCATHLHTLSHLRGKVWSQLIGLQIVVCHFAVAIQKTNAPLQTNPPIELKFQKIICMGSCNCCLPVKKPVHVTAQRNLKFLMPVQHCEYVSDLWEWITYYVELHKGKRMNLYSHNSNLLKYAR